MILSFSPTSKSTELTLSSDFNVLTQQYSLGNLSKDRQRFVDSIILISTPDWLKDLSSFENVVVTPFEYGLRTSNNARLC